MVMKDAWDTINFIYKWSSEGEAAGVAVVVMAAAIVAIAAIRQ